MAPGPRLVPSLHPRHLTCFCYCVLDSGLRLLHIDETLFAELPCEVMQAKLELEAAKITTEVWQKVREDS